MITMKPCIVQLLCQHTEWLFKLVLNIDFKFDLMALTLKLSLGIVVTYQYCKMLNRFAQKHTNAIENATFQHTRA